MLTLTHLNMQLFPMLLLGTLFAHDLVVGHDKSQSARLFRSLILFTMAVMTTDLLSWLPSDFDLSPTLGMAVGWGSNLLYLIFSLGVALTWIFYVAAVLNQRKLLVRWEWQIVLAVAAVAYLLLVLSSPWTGLVFTLDEHWRYVRGPLYLMPYVLYPAMMAFASGLVLVHWRKEPSRQMRTDMVYMACFPLLILFGAAMQLTSLDWWLIWPMTSLAILLVHINLRNRQITTDALTDLNNRRSLDKLLLWRIQHLEDRGPFAFYLLDVDRFKEVNDTYGHAVGDEMLCRAADLLRDTLGLRGAFLARFGGDEFAAVLECSDEVTADLALTELDDALVQTNERGTMPCPLSLSTGWAICTDPEEDPETLLSRADEAMYRRKKKHHGG